MCIIDFDELPFEAIFRGTTVKGICFTIAVDLGMIISYTFITIKEVKL
jgi:hypothetical protein